MANGTINLGQSGSILGQIIWSSSSNGTSANSSQVTASIQCRKASNTTQPTKGTWTGNLNIGGTNQGISWNTSIGTSWVTLKEFTITKSHNQDGTGTCYIQGSINGPSGTTQSGKTVSGEQTVTLDKIDRWATITEAPDFNDTQNPTIQYSNPAGNSISSLQACISLTGNIDDIKYRDISKTGNSYTFNLTEAERNVLRNATTTNSRSVIFFVKSVIDGQTYYTTLTRTFSISNGGPTFDVAYLDTNSSTTAITGNNQYIIQGNSSLQIKVTNAKAYKGASLVSAWTFVNGIYYSGAFGHDGNGSNWININVGEVYSSQNLDIEVEVEDTRGNRTKKKLTLKILQWSLPTALFTMRRTSNFYSETTLKADATYSYLTVGNTSKNTLTIQYQIKKVSDTNYGSLITIENNTETTFEADNTSEWNVRVILTDKIGSTTYNLVLNRGIPIVYFDDLLSATGFNCFPKVRDSVYSSDLPIDDEIYIGSQVLYDNYQMTSSGKTAVLGAYNFKLLQGIFDGIEIPSTYERAYRITAQVSTRNENYANVILNNISSSLVNTWSGETFRATTSTRIFKESEITLESVVNYTTSVQKGCNLYCNNTGNYNATFWNITVHGYLVKKINDLLPTRDIYVNTITRTGKEKAYLAIKKQFPIDYPEKDISTYNISINDPHTMDGYDNLWIADVRLSNPDNPYGDFHDYTYWCTEDTISEDVYD